MSKRPSMREMLEKKEKQKGKEDRLEKGSFRCYCYFGNSYYRLECHLCIIREAFSFSIFLGELK